MFVDESVKMLYYKMKLNMLELRISFQFFLYYYLYIH